MSIFNKLFGSKKDGDENKSQLDNDSFNLENLFKYKFSFTTQKPSKESLNPDINFEDKLKKIQDILNEYVDIKITSDWEIDEEDEFDNYKEFLCAIDFESPLVFWDHHNGETAPEDVNDVPYTSNNLLINFDQKNGICHEISRVLINQKNEKKTHFNIECIDTQLEIDFNIYHNEIDQIDFIRF